MLYCVVTTRQIRAFRRTISRSLQVWAWFSGTSVVSALRSGKSYGVNSLVGTRDQLGVEAQQSVAPKRRGPHILSTLLFITALGFAAVAGYLYWNEQEADKNEPTPPPAQSGEWGFAQVQNAFKEAGLSTEAGRTNGHSDQIKGIPGQFITVNGSDVYVFIFSPTAESSDPIAAAVQVYDAIDQDSIELTRQSSEGVIGEGEELHVFHGSNIIAVMVGGKAEDVEKVRAVIEGLI